MVLQFVTVLLTIFLSTVAVLGLFVDTKEVTIIGHSIILIVIGTPLVDTIVMP